MDTQEYDRVRLYTEKITNCTVEKKTCLATQNIRGVALSRYECAEMQDRFSVFIQVWILPGVRESIVIKEPTSLFGIIILW